MIIGVKDYRGGQTLKERVGEGDERLLRRLSGFDPKTGPAIPDKLPTRLSTTALHGGAQACTFTASNDRVSCTGHGYSANNAVRFGTTLGGVAAGTTYYVKTVVDANTFTISATSGGALLDLTANGANTVWRPMLAQVPLAFRDASGVRFICRDADEKVRIMGTNGVWGAAAGQPTFDVIADSGPFQLGPLAVFPTKDGMMVYEPDSTTTKSRPFGLKGPADFTPEGRAVGLGGEQFSRDVAGSSSIGYSGYTACTTAATTDLVTAVAHGLGVGAHIQFSSSPGAIFPLAGFWVKTVPTADTFTISLTPDGVLYDITVTGANSFRMMGASNVPAVTPSGTVEAQLFDIGTWEVVPGAQDVGVTNHTDYAALSFNVGSMPNVQSFRLNSADISLTNMRYLVIDFVLKWQHQDPNVNIQATGDFVNGDAGGASGFQLVLHKDDACTDTEANTIRRMHIPRLSSDGRVNRVVFALGSAVDAQTCKGISIRTAPFYVGLSGAAQGTVGYVLWVYSFAFSADWNYKGNFLFPSVKYSHSPWARSFPPDPGSGWASSSAIVLETWAETNAAVVSPDRPKVRWQWLFRGRSSLSLADYDQLLSNPSAETEAFLADPWRVYTLTVTLPTDEDGNDVTDDYGDYATHVLFYRSIYTGLGFDQIVEELGVWRAPQYAGNVLLTDLAMDDTGRWQYPCTFAAATDIITSSTHRLSQGDIITFPESVGGVTRGNLYYVLTTPDADTFTISAQSDGTKFNLTADVSTTWSSAGKVLQIDGYDLPLYLEPIYDVPPSARYGAVADNRVYLACLGYNSITATWLRQLYLAASNLGNYEASPTTPRMTETGLALDGQELGKVSPDAYQIRALVVSRDEKAVFTERGVFELLGSDAASPWRFYRIGQIGTVSAKTVADDGIRRIWHGPDGGPDGGYFYRRDVQGEGVAVSRGILRSSLFDWTKAHQGVMSNSRYVFFGYYNDTVEATPWALIIYDLETGGWRSRHNTSYELAGMAVDPGTDNVYALTHDGDVVNVFGGTADYGGDQTYKIGTQYMKMGGPNVERETEHLLLEAVTDQASISVTLDFYSQGRLDASDTSRSLTLTSTQTKYGMGDLNVNLIGDAVRIVLTYTGTTPPDIHFLGIAVPDKPREA